MASGTNLRVAVAALCTLGACLVLAPSQVAAQDAGQDAGQDGPAAGQLRLAAGLALLSLDILPDFDRDPVGVTFGLTKLAYCLDFGYQLSLAMLIGAQIQMTYNKPAGLSTDDDAFTFALWPYFQYLFLAGAIRPFIGAQLGGGVQSKTAFLDRQGIFGFGALAGVYLFLTASAALSPYLQIGYERRTNVPSGSGASGFSNENLIRFALFLTLSVWFSGGGSSYGQAQNENPSPFLTTASF